jgi:hypothetical protein
LVPVALGGEGTELVTEGVEVGHGCTLQKMGLMSGAARSVSVGEGTWAPD